MQVRVGESGSGLLDVKTGTGGATVATTGANSFDDGTSPTSSRLCVACHESSDNQGFPMTNHIGAAKFSVEITDIFDLETTVRFYRTERPPPRSDGTVPERNDYQLIVSLALEIG